MAKEGHYALYLSRTSFRIKTQFVSLVAFHEFPVHQRGQQLLLHPTKWSYIQLYTIFSHLKKLRLVLVFSITLRESFLPRSLMSSVLPWVSFVLFYFTFFFFFGAIPKMKLNVLVCRLTVNFSFRDMFTGHYKKKKDWCFTQT